MLLDEYRVQPPDLDDWKRSEVEALSRYHAAKLREQERQD